MFTASITVVSSLYVCSITPLGIIRFPQSIAILNDRLLLFLRLPMKERAVQDPEVLNEVLKCHFDDHGILSLEYTTQLPFLSHYQDSV